MHAVLQQAFVAHRVFLGEPVAVAEVHAHRRQADPRARALDVELQRDAFVGLDVQHQPVRTVAADLGAAQRRQRRRLEADRDLGGALAQTLAGAQIERHAGPAPGVHLQLHRHIGLGVGIRRHRVFLAVARHGVATDRTGRVLAADHVGRTQRPHRLDHLGAPAQHRRRGEGRRRLHRDHRQQLEQVVGHHVTQAAGGVVEAAAPFHADGLGRGDLHMVDAVAVPHRLEQAVGEAEGEDVLHRFLAEEMVDAEHLVLVQHAADDGVELACALQVVAERLLHDHPAPAAAGALLDQPGRPQLFDHRREEARRGGQVEQHVAAGAVLRADLLQQRAQAAIGGCVVEVAAQVVQARTQPAPHLLVQAIGLELRVAVGHQPAHRIAEHAPPRHFADRAVVHADDREFLGQRTAVAQVVQRRQHQAPGQVAAGAEHHDQAGRSGLGGIAHGWVSCSPIKPCRRSAAWISATCE
ncbi:hypothetical protein NB689_002502 [Xanthomonas sacchari]|nr:hypothetical protein [Xanthomonas sacchari]